MNSLAKTSLGRPCRSLGALALMSRRPLTYAPVRTMMMRRNVVEKPAPRDSLPSEWPSEPEFAAQVVHGRSVIEPYYHPRTHSIPVALIHFRSYHLSLLNLFIHFASHAASALGIPITKPASLPTQRRLWTVIKGPFVHKKAQENFERKTHKRVIKVYDADQVVVDKWVAYLTHHILAGVGVRVVRWHRAPVGIGARTHALVKGEVRDSTAKSVEDLAAEIVEEETRRARRPAKKARREREFQRRMKFLHKVGIMPEAQMRERVAHSEETLQAKLAKLKAKEEQREMLLLREAELREKQEARKAGMQKSQQLPDEKEDL